MLRPHIPLLAVSLALGSAAGAAPSETRRDLAGEARSVEDLDLERYAGLWHEIARFPNRFQKRCVGDVTATYTLREDGKIDVVNACLVGDGSRIEAKGRAKRAKKDGPPSRLKVRFAPRILGWLPMVWADYWVLELAPDYSHALVGTPDHKYLWILARAPEVEPETYRRLVAVAAEQGYPVRKLKRSRWAGAPPAATGPASADERVDGQ